MRLPNTTSTPTIAPVVEHRELFTLNSLQIDPKSDKDQAAQADSGSPVPRKNRTRETLSEMGHGSEGVSGPHGSARTYGDLVERDDGLEVDVVTRSRRAATNALHLSLRRRCGSGEWGGGDQEGGEPAWIASEFACPRGWTGRQH
jgi:hypothetical protein